MTHPFWKRFYEVEEVFIKMIAEDHEAASELLRSIMEENKVELGIQVTSDGLVVTGGFQHPLSKIDEFCSNLPDLDLRVLKFISRPIEYDAHWEWSMTDDAIYLYGDFDNDRDRISAAIGEYYLDKFRVVPGVEKVLQRYKPTELYHAVRKKHKTVWKNGIEEYRLP
jgi:hypothetical protein